MSPSETILWNNIENFHLDDPEINFSFSARLARENGWAHKYALRVVEEYKKFIFLCCISEKGITPSDPVDQAWHLHLTYTKSYWTHLCGNTLNKEIHHNPTKGGRNEAEKFNNYYTNTQLFYQEKFGYAPPADIWQDNQTRFSDIAFQRVNLNKYWLIKKSPRVKKMIVTVSLLLLAFVFIQASSDDGIWVFFAVFIGILIIAAILKAVFRAGTNKNGEASSGCSTGGCSSADHYHNDSGGEGDSSGCSGSGCSGCGGGGD